MSVLILEQSIRGSEVENLIYYTVSLKASS